MKRLTLCIVILLLAGAVLLYGADITDFTSKMVNFAVSVTTHTNTEVRPVNGNRRDLTIYNPSTHAVYIGYDSSMSTTTAHSLAASGSLQLEYYTGSVYGIVTSTVNAVEIRGIELQYE